MPDGGFVVWLTGPPAVGKTTTARTLASRLRARGLERVEILDGDEVRVTFSAGLGFSRADRETNVRRVGFVAELLERNGVAVIVALISPFEDVREEVRRRLRRPLLVFLDCPVEELARRDPKGQYRRAMDGTLESFTGVSDPYEPPAAPDLHLRTDRMDAAAVVERIAAELERRGLLAPDRV